MRLLESIGYIRVATEEQAEPGLSFDDQLRKIQGQAAASDLDLIDIITDAGISCSDTKWPGRQKLLAMVQQGQIECVVIAKLDRIFRSISDVERIVDLLQAKQVALICCAEGINTATAFGHFFVKGLSWFAQWRREMSSESTRSALRKKRTQGKRTGTPLYGYSATADGTLVKNDTEQKVLSLIRQGRKAGRGWAQIARDLNKAGYRNRAGKPFDRHRVSHIAQKIGLPRMRHTKRSE